MNDPITLAAEAISKAKLAGADAADALVFKGSDVSVRVRLGKVETVERSEDVDVGLRVFIQSKEGLKQAIVSTNDIAPTTLKSLAEQAVAMAKISPPDKYLGLADKGLYANNLADYDLFDASEHSLEALTEIAITAENSALQVKGVTNSDGADIHNGKHHSALVTSEGFAGEYRSSSSSLSVSIVAGSGTGMETDYDYSVARFFNELKPAKNLGKSAGERAVKRLSPRKVKSCRVPVVFEARVARSLLGVFENAIHGDSVTRGTSFLKNKMGEALFRQDITITDDPLRKRGLGSRPFDAEGIAGQQMTIVEGGVLKHWLLDLRSSKQLNMAPTGHASRGTSGPPSPSSTNFFMGAGKLSMKELIADITSGFYVTDTFGMGINGVTGDYSQGASGFWIENGEIAYPVSEVTIASNLLDMFRELTPANDLEFLYGTDAPTIRIEGMTVAGT